MRRFLALICLFGTTYGQSGGGNNNGQGGSMTNVNNCTDSCDISACEANSDCNLIWSELEGTSYRSEDRFLDAYDELCNQTEFENANFSCDATAVDDLFECIINSDCWDTIKTTYSPNCTYFSEFSFEFTVYTEDDSVSTTRICNADWESYVTDIVNWDNAIIRVNSQACSDSGSDSGENSENSEGSSEGGESGSGNSQNNRRLLQEGGESSEGGENSENGSGSGSGSDDDCAVTYTATIGYTADYDGTDGDLADYYDSMATNLKAQASSLSGIEIYIRCYENECCEHLDDGQTCTNYISDNNGQCTNADYTCLTTNTDNGSMTVTGLAAFMLILVALFAY